MRVQMVCAAKDHSCPLPPATCKGMPARAHGRTAQATQPSLWCQALNRAAGGRGPLALAAAHGGARTALRTRPAPRPAHLTAVAAGLVEPGPAEELVQVVKAGLRQGCHHQVVQVLRSDSHLLVWVLRLLAVERQSISRGRLHLLAPTLTCWSVISSSRVCPSPPSQLHWYRCVSRSACGLRHGLLADPAGKRRTGEPTGHGCANRARH